MKKIFAMLAVLLTATTAFARQPIQSPETFIQELESCFKAKDKSCISNQLSNHLPPSVDIDKGTVDATAEIYIQWIGNDSFYAAHKVLSKELGTIIYSPTYLIEDTTGSFLMFSYTLLKRQGNWYLNQWQFSNKENELEAALGVKF